MFRRNTQDWPTTWERPPWWRTMSLVGWGLFLLGLFATVAFVGGVVSGDVLLLLTLTGKSGPMQVSYGASPFWYFVCMAINFVVAVGVWVLFAAWRQERGVRGLTRRSSGSPSAPAELQRWASMEGLE